MQRKKSEPPEIVPAPIREENCYVFLTRKTSGTPALDTPTITVKREVLLSLLILLFSCLDHSPIMSTKQQS
ncbi:hypothetical protein OJAV_G00154220 [Oryzias javanicus]|uniref:Uncharacterized protein n=1 Tax=Oryzias javanicus TaxID=123683 RepID=A0A437CHM5_ORYJA|nr:hypothetical protein OJAV_G00154220 [Oryzias javanicus]